MVQAENELGSAGSKGDDIPRGSADPEENARHVRFFLDILREHGVDVPIIDINRFPGREEIEDLDRRRRRIRGQLLAAARGIFAPSIWRPGRATTSRCITIESMGGMFCRFFDWPPYSHTDSYQGPIVKPEYIEALTYQHLAEGYNGINYYVFADGQHPASGNERMLPERDMNYQAPITAAGTLRESYRAIKRIGWFLRAFGDEFLRSKPHAVLAARLSPTGKPARAARRPGTSSSNTTRKGASRMGTPRCQRPSRPGAASPRV